MRVRLMQAASLALTLFVLFTPATALAWDPFGSACGAGGATGDATACQAQTTSNPLVGTDGLLTHISALIALVAGVAAVIIIIIGSLKYITSAGDAQAAASAKNAVLYALIGLAIIAAAGSIITFVLSKL